MRTIVLVTGLICVLSGCDRWECQGRIPYYKGERFDCSRCSASTCSEKMIDTGWRVCCGSDCHTCGEQSSYQYDGLVFPDKAGKVPDLRAPDLRPPDRSVAPDLSKIEAHLPDMVPPPDVTVAPDLVSYGGYGNSCNKKSAPCAQGLSCVTLDKASFCTKTCTLSGDICLGTPSNHTAYCLLSENKINYCVFLCKLGANTWSCPPDLKCDTVANPPGSSQYVCMP